MDSEKKVYESLHEPQPETIDPDYENLPPEIEDEMRKIMAADTRMTRAEAYKKATMEAGEGNKES